jgi:hypothetical protein
MNKGKYVFAEITKNNDSDEGTYTIHLSGTRSATSGIFQSNQANLISVYPNLSTGNIIINTNNRIGKIIITAQSGTVITSISINKDL